MARRRDDITSAEIGLTLLVIGKMFLSAWLVMLVLGMFAGYMAMPGLAIGYWATMGIMTMFAIASIKIKAS